MDVSENDIDSTSTTSQFITYLIDALTERDANRLIEPAPPPLPLNSNIFDIIGNHTRRRFISATPTTPLFSRRNQFEELLRNSLYQDKNIKKVLSEKGSEQLKVVKFDPDKHDMKECVITQEKFKKDEEVICLPCNHIFNKEAIKTWLKEDSSKCPICRHELDFVEKKEDLPERPPSTNIRLSNNQTEPFNDISYNRMFNNMRFLYNPSDVFTRRPRRSFLNNIADMESQYVYDRNLQNAILNSVIENNLDSDITDDYTSGDVLDDIDDIDSDIVENDIADSDVYLNMMENDLVLEDVDDDENFFYD